MDYKFIHLLYVPTMACNMGCKYCYLEDNTVDDKTDKGVVDTLRFAVDKFKDSGVIPFNISYMVEKLLHYLKIIFMI